MSTIGPSDAEEALLVATPMIAELLKLDWVDGPDLYIMVAKRWEASGPPGFATLAFRQFGDTGEWSHDYQAIAHGKTAISARTGLSSREAQLLHPELLEENDVLYWGNAICGDIIVSCSGIQPWMDEAIAKAVLAILMGMQHQHFDALRANLPPNAYKYNG